MKTAMQEWFDELKANYPYMANEIFDKGFNKYLEKEKEQIIEAYCDGAKGGANGTKGQHDFGWVSRHTRNKYYNNKYNQDIITISETKRSNEGIGLNNQNK
jgi:hypothetical protein